MSWQETTPINTRTATGMVNYSYSLKRGALVTLPGAVAEAVKWKAGQRLKLFVGAGEHAGKLRLVADEGGPLIVRACRATALQVHIGKIEALPAREVKRCAVAHEVDGAGLTTTLPPHALAVAPAPRPAAATGGGGAVSIMSGPPPERPAGGQKVDVVDKVVGGAKHPPRFAAASGTRG